jgi:broad specificity phosphatase PhoE
VPVEFTFIRHGQTTGNAAGRWQGHTNSALTAEGRRQAEKLAVRLSHKNLDLVVSSDLDRATQTAAALGLPVETDERWREPFLGSWEDRTTEEIMADDAEDLAALFAGEDIAIGGGERSSDVVARAAEAFYDLVDRVGDGSVAVVGHGMSLLLLLASLLGTRLPTPLRLLGNTSLATAVMLDGHVTITRYNDDTHLGYTALPHFLAGPDATELLLVRHGRTDANDEDRWQGHSDDSLNGEGRRQVSLLGPAFPPISALYSSPLTRAMGTAAAIGSHQGLTAEVKEDLKEIGFGAWEGMTRAEIASVFPEDFAVFNTGADVVRGGTGETFAAVRKRMAAVISCIVSRHHGETVGVVSHGGVTRAYVTDLLGLSYQGRHRLGLLGNTGYSRLAYTSRGPSLVSWNLAPHLAVSV